MRTLLIMAGLAVFFCAAAYAQDEQIPLDESGSVYVLSADMEKQFRLFPGVEGFVEARLYRISPSGYSLEVVYRAEGKLMRQKTPLDEAGLRDFRTRLAERSAASGYRIKTDQEGRYALLTSTALYSLLLYGPMSAQLLDISSGSDIAALECLAGAAGFFVPFWMTSERAVTGGEALAYTTGGGFGALHGALFGLVLFGDASMPDRLLPGLVLGGSLAEGIGGYYLAGRLGLTEGRVGLVSSGALWGTVWALEGMAVTSRSSSPRGMGAALLAGSFGFAAAGFTVSGQENYTSGDVLVNNLAAALGAYIPFAVGKAAAVTSERTYAGLSLAGSMAGAVAGHFLVRGRDFASGDAGLISLGMFSGGLAGFAAAYYSAPDSISLSLTLSSVGATAGFAFMYMLFRDSAHADADAPFRIEVAPSVPAPVRPATGFFAGRGSSAYDALIPCVSAVYSF